MGRPEFVMCWFEILYNRITVYAVLFLNQLKKYMIYNNSHNGINRFFSQFKFSGSVAPAEDVSSWFKLMDDLAQATDVFYILRSTHHFINELKVKKTLRSCYFCKKKVHCQFRNNQLPVTKPSWWNLTIFCFVVERTNKIKTDHSQLAI